MKVRPTYYKMERKSTRSLEQMRDSAKNMIDLISSIKELEKMLESNGKCNDDYERHTEHSLNLKRSF